MPSTSILQIDLPVVAEGAWDNELNQEYLTVLGLYNNIRPFVALITAINNAANAGDRTIAVNALKASQIKTVDLSSVKPGGSRKKRQSKKRKNNKNHSNNNQ